MWRQGRKERRIEAQCEGIAEPLLRLPSPPCSRQWGCPMQSASDADQASSQDIFLNAWQTYRKVLTSNYMYHREVYDLLREILVFELARPFVFLDIACGDALASFNALKGTAVQSYSGIDISKAAL